MDRFTIAEAVLAQFSTKEQASQIVGDLLEASHGRSAGFWHAYLRVLVRMGWWRIIGLFGATTSLLWVMGIASATGFHRLSADFHPSRPGWRGHEHIAVAALLWAYPVAACCWSALLLLTFGRVPRSRGLVAAAALPLLVTAQLLAGPDFQLTVALLAGMVLLAAVACGWRTSRRSLATVGSGAAVLLGMLVAAFTAAYPVLLGLARAGKRLHDVYRPQATLLCMLVFWLAGCLLAVGLMRRMTRTWAPASE